MNLQTLFILASASCWLMIPIGYEFNLQNTLYPLSKNITDQKWSFFETVWPLGALVGSLSSPILARALSRKYNVFVVPPIFFILAGVLTTFEFFATAVSGRLLFAVGAGLALSSLPLYLMEISRGQILDTVAGGFLNAAFWLGCSFASGLGLDTVLGSKTFWSYFALIPPFLSCLTLVLSPLFPESPLQILIAEKRDDRSIDQNIDDRVIEALLPFHDSDKPPMYSPMLKRLDKEFLSKQPRRWSWSDRRCQKSAIESILIGFLSISFGPAPMFAFCTQILTSPKLNYSRHVASAIEGCTATIYASFALLGLVFSYLIPKSKKGIVLLLSSTIATAALFCSIVFVLTAQYGRTDSTTAKMGFLWSFLICAGAYQMILAPNAYVAPFYACRSHFIRQHCFAFSNASSWLGFLIWTLVLGQSTATIGGWCLAPFLAASVSATALIYFWRVKAKDEDEGENEEQFSEATYLLGGDLKYWSKDGETSKASTSYGTLDGK